MKLLENEKQILLENNIDVEKYIGENNVTGLLSEIDDLILKKGFDSYYIITEFGEKIEEIYASISARNLDIEY